MALIKCPECKKNISDTANKCPNCGYKFKRKRKILDLIKNKNKRRELLNQIKNMDKKKKIICFSISVFILVLIVIFLKNIFAPYSYTKEESEENIVRSQINITLMVRATYYNDKLSYAYYRSSYISEEEENKYESAGYVYFNRQGSSKKWETDYKCTCSYYETTKSASCSCTLGSSASIVP